MTTPTPETLRDRVAEAIAVYCWGCPGDGEKYTNEADAALAAIPKLSPEARETIKEALGAAEEEMLTANEEYRRLDPKYRVDYGHIGPNDPARIAAARAELESLP